jgi:hypothetical protein
MNQRQQARGFYKWFDVVNQENQKRRFLRKAILYWKRRGLATWFRRWAENHFKQHEMELAYELDTQEQKKRDL